MIRRRPLVFTFASLLSRVVHSETVRMVSKVAAFGALLGILWVYFGFSLFWALIVTFVAYLLTGGWKFVKVAYLTLPRDLRFAIFPNNTLFIFGFIIIK